ncbi:hypothetical protein SARC_07347 [Sphaeroforma arctica JP610]|uniref:Uncharacterized protein n=1 Tax=Sphaeroforma arctica JP610 TaxID=667725 RepID=A0A0L0FTY3_9EUKA|nr:hypothetical protein SARC_07347 [Sphaeroforma arctica JP610]KNC80282.1 hypothetical protein SARC_07347 [Sphaeroforma arctica JP610]|eukprot:XP_014154184.1 hypothetical protein SARC_07347 [Sphaeroforma arctica JP610]
MQVEGCSDTTKGRAAITLDVDAETIYKVRILSSKLRELSVSGLNGNDTYTVYAWPTDTELLETTVHKRFMPVDWKKNPDTRLAYFANPPLGQSMFKELMFIVHGTDDEVTDSAKSRSAKAAEKFFQKRCPKEATPFVILSGSTASEPHFKALNADAAGDLRAATSTVRPCAKDGVVKSLQDVCDILTNNRVFSDEHPETLDTGIPDSKLTKADAGVEGIDEVVIPVFAPKDDALAMAVFVADALSLDSSEKEKLVKLELGDYDCVIVGKNGVEVIQA